MEPWRTSCWLIVPIILFLYHLQDILFVDYTVNDKPHIPFKSEIRRGFERLLRKLLALPHKPAVVLMHHFCPLCDPKFTYWGNAERELDEFASYYGLPTLSIKAATHHLMAADVPGFSVAATRSNGTWPPAPRHVYFYWDWIHPDGNTGARWGGARRGGRVCVKAWGGGRGGGGRGSGCTTGDLPQWLPKADDGPPPRPRWPLHG